MYTAQHLANGWFVCTVSDDGHVVLITRVNGPYGSKQAAHQMAQRMNARLERLTSRAGNDTKQQKQ